MIRKLLFKILLYPVALFFYIKGGAVQRFLRHITE